MLRLKAVCDSCGNMTSQIPPRGCTACGAHCFSIFTEPEDPVAVEQREDPDQRPYVWEDDD